MHLMDPLLRRSLFRQHKMSKVGPTVVRLAKKAARKSTVPIDFSSVPSSYYTLELPADAKAYLLHIRRSLAAERKLRYRHARAAHFRMKIRRGMLPMPFEENEWCTKNGYEIFGAGDLPANRATLLMARGYPQKRPDEWMALKVAFVQDTMVGSEDLPTRTAVRKIPDILHLTKP